MSNTSVKNLETFYPKNTKEWRQWLKQNHATRQSVGLILYKKQANIPTISWSEAVDQALCFGWIDSTRRTIDENKFVQTFGKRKPKGTWSKINKDKVEQLIANKQMTTAGLQSIEVAKQNGSWVILDEVEELIIPKDLETAFKQNQGSKNYFDTLSKSGKKIILQKLVLAKRPETRQKRINEIMQLLLKK